MRVATLCLLVRESPGREVLLGFKKAGFGAGKYTGFGGKVEAGETVMEAAARELEEETGIRVSKRDLQVAGRLAFEFPARPSWSQVVHVFLAATWQGQAVESREMVPRWFAVDEIPYEQMWQDGAHWLPPILAGCGVEAHFTFGKDNETIAALEVKTWNASFRRGEGR
jgi:8-oxo-dGTP diphosphatase